MKMVFTSFLIINFLIEALAASSLIGTPEQVGVANAGPGNMWAMHYGFAVLGFASAVIWLWPYRDHHAAVTAVLGMLMTFHCAVLTSLLLEGVQQAGMIIHSVLALSAIVLFALRSRWCNAPAAL